MDTEERERCSDTAPILPKGSEERETAPPGAISQFYTLPKTRYRNVAEAVLIVDSILSLALWVTGDNTLHCFVFVQAKRVSSCRVIPELPHQLSLKSGKGTRQETTE